MKVKIIRKPVPNKTAILMSPRCLHSFCKLIGVVHKYYKEPLFCTSGIWVVVSAFSACMSVPAPKKKRAIYSPIKMMAPIESSMVPLVARNKASAWRHLLSRKHLLLIRNIHQPKLLIDMAPFIARSIYWHKTSNVVHINNFKA